MTYHCENCGQPMLETDTICWHCGAAPSKPRPATEEAGQQAGDEGMQQPVPLTALVVYGAVMVLITIAFLATTQALGKKPLVVVNAQSLAAGLAPFTDQEQRFTLNLPPAWQRLEKGNQAQQATFAQLVESDDRLQTAVAPLGDVVEDLEFVFIASPELPLDNTAVSPFLVIARSTVLNRLTLAQIIAVVRQSDPSIEILRDEIVETFYSQRAALFVLEKMETKEFLRCQQRIIQEREATFLVAGCAPRTQFASSSSELDNILSTFQPLSR